MKGEKDIMSSDWVHDIAEMHRKYGVNEWVGKQLDEGNYENLRKFLEFRMAFLDEELGETKAAIENGDPSEIVDGLIDLCVIAVGTMDAFGIDARASWNRVQKANMAKEVGVKESRPNELGLPDLVKPEGWTAPEHSDNVGYIPDAL